MAAEDGRAGIRSRLRVAWGVFTGVLLLAYPLAVYIGLTRWSTRGVALVLLVLLAPTVVSRLRRADAGTRGTLVAVPLVTAILLSLGAALNAAGFVLVVPVAVNAALLVTFAATLRSSRPMIERFARLQVPDLREEEVAWCRRWTWIWCGFFAVNGAAAGALALWAPLSWWTAYNGGIAYGLIGLLFAAEYVLRKLRFGRFGTGLHDRLLARLAGAGGERS